MHMFLEQTSGAHGAARFQRTSCADLRQARVDDGAFFSLMTLQPLAGRTNKGVAGFFVMEIFAFKQRTVATIVHSAIGRYVRFNPFGFACFGLLAVGISRIRDYMQRFSRFAHRCLYGFGHRLQATIVGRFRADLVDHNQRMFCIHSDLHVVGWHLPARNAASVFPALRPPLWDQSLLPPQPRPAPSVPDSLPVLCDHVRSGCYSLPETLIHQWLPTRLAPTPPLGQTESVPLLLPSPRPDASCETQQ